MTEIDFNKRKLFIGGSDVSACLGLSRYKTPYQLFIDKMEMDNRKEETEAMYFGNKLESLVREEYTRRTGKKVNQNYPEIINPKYPFLIAHVDGLIEDISSFRILECKTTRWFNKEEWGNEEGTDNVPIPYLCQVAAYCIVADCISSKPIDGADIAALGSTSDFRIFHYSRNQELETLIIEKTKFFYENHMMTGVPPSPTYNDDLSKIYKIAKKESVMVATNDLVSKAEELKYLSQQIKEMEEKEQLLKNEIQLEMKEAETLISINGEPLATWKTQERKTLDINRIKAERMEIYNEYLKASVSRVFRIK